MTNSKPTGSKSYVRVDCYGDADPKYNRLQLRTDPPTFITLNPGSNYLTIEEYPALKYGFKQIDNPEIEGHTNCEDVREIDFSDYDGSYLTTLDQMFYKMPLEFLTFGDMTTPNLKSAKMAFAEIGGDYENGYVDIDLSNLDFSRLENGDFMFQGSNLGVLKLNHAHFDSLVRARKFIRHTHINRLEMDGIEINNPAILDIHIYTHVIVSLKNTRINIAEEIIKSIETKRIQHGDSTPATYILDDNVNVDITNNNGMVECSFTQVTELTVSELLNRIDSYLNGNNQKTPAIIWFENKPYDCLKFARTPDYLGLAETLSMNQHIAMDSFVGSRMGTHLVRDKEDGSITLMTPEQIFHYDEGRLREKMLILRCMSSETGQQAVKMGKLIKESLGINVMIFMPYFRKETIAASFNEYSQFILKDR